MKKRILIILLALSLAFSLAAGCMSGKNGQLGERLAPTDHAGEISADSPEKKPAGNALLDSAGNPGYSAVFDEDRAFSLNMVPPYSGEAYVLVNNNEPYFTRAEITDEAYERYSELDALGRCGVTCASVGPELMPTEERGDIGMIKPAGWHMVKYDCVEGKYLYNRCHLIGYQLTGENANPQNLLTGTRYLNMEGMLPFENMAADYVEDTGNHVMYRVTPIYEGNDLLARGVLMEGYSVEDEGEGICYCVFAYNVQPGVEIDYATGESWLATEGLQEGDMEQQETVSGDKAPRITYILNTNTKKFHYPDCASVEDIKARNMEKFTGSREEALAMGYAPCGRCNP